MQNTNIGDSSELTQEFELTFSPEMEPKVVKSVSDNKAKPSTTSKRNNKPKRCPDTVDFIEEVFGDKYKKCKGSGY